MVREDYATPAPTRRRYDVVVAGARCAGAPTAMLLARAGLDVLVVDPVEEGRDTLSTHALMWAGVLQLHRWGLLDAVRAGGTPPVGSTTFHYAGDTIPIPLKPKAGIEGLFAPRRTVLDPILVAGARAAGAEVIHGWAVVDLVRDGEGRVRGATLAGRDRRTVEVAADLVVGADGVRSRVARLVGAVAEHVAASTGATIYGYVTGLEVEGPAGPGGSAGPAGYHWHYDVGGGAGAIPTNDGATCVFVGLPAARFAASVPGGLEPLFREVLREVAPDLAARVERAERAAGPLRLRAYAGIPGFIRRSHGPGWALVGDAGYFKDPITAHGISDALRDAELLARTVLDGRGVGGASDLVDYQLQRDALSKELLRLTHRIAAYDWSLDEVKELHLALSDEMKREVAWMRRWDEEPATRMTAAAVG